MTLSRRREDNSPGKKLGLLTEGFPDSGIADRCGALTYLVAGWDKLFAPHGRSVEDISIN